MSQSSTILQWVSRRYWQLTEHFLPDWVSGNREATNQARMFLLSHFLGPCFGLSAPLALYLSDPTPGPEIIVLAVSILSFWVFPFLLKSGIAYGKLVLLSIAIDWFAIFWACFHFGGSHSPTLVWVLIIPILSVFYIGGDHCQKKELVAMGVAASLIFMIVCLIFGLPPNDIPSAAMKVLGATSAVAVMSYVAVMAVYYARIFDAGVILEREVARRRLMSIELRRAVEAADRAASMKSEFLARMSHELRSPLNAIIGYGELLREECDEASDQLMRKDLDRILDAGAYLTRLIDMILDLAKIDAGKMRFDPQRHVLRRIMDDVVEKQAERIADNGNTLSITVDPEVAEVTVDRSRLFQVIDSIVSNAAAATNGGTISIIARPAEVRGGPAFEIVVSDTGCGICPEILPVIFETFLIDREAAEGRYGGTGLALSVTSKLCEAMGGSVAVESAEGVGSTFTVTLPAKSVASATLSTPEVLSAA